MTKNLFKNPSQLPCVKTRKNINKAETSSEGRGVPHTGNGRRRRRRRRRPRGPARVEARGVEGGDDEEAGEDYSGDDRGVDRDEERLPAPPRVVAPSPIPHLPHHHHKHQHRRQLTERPSSPSRAANDASGYPCLRWGGGPGQEDGGGIRSPLPQSPPTGAVT